MEISKFLVGVLTIAVGLWAAGRLTPTVLKLSRDAVASQKDHQSFSLKTMVIFHEYLINEAREV